MFKVEKNYNPKRERKFPSSRVPKTHNKKLQIGGIRSDQIKGSLLVFG
jgi:hypothetical protein